MIWENQSLPTLGSFIKAIYCEQLLWGPRIFKQPQWPHKPQLFASICDVGARIGVLILSLIKPGFGSGGHVFIRLYFFFLNVFTDTQT